MSGKYDARFMSSIKAGSFRSAVIVFDSLAPLIDTLETSIIDIGCGSATWASAFAARFPDAVVCGVDGPYVDHNTLEIDSSNFRVHDLSHPLPAVRRYGLAISLEVAEHLPSESAPDLIHSLINHSDHILFSAAPPGQGGEFHINEQPLEYWRDLFRKHGYVAVDCVRPVLREDSRIEPWYRFNSILYVRADKLSDLPSPYKAMIVPDEQKLAEVAPLWWRARCAFLRLLPSNVVLAMARIRRRLLSNSRSALASSSTMA